MNTTSELLHELNLRRASVGKPALKSWKDSRAKLEAALAALPAVVAPVEDVPAEKPAKAAKKEKATGKDNGGGRKPSDIVTWCRENGVNPKVARNKLRRAKLKAPYVIDAKALEILTGDARKGK